jgi:hypothetical protein
MINPSLVFTEVLFHRSTNALQKGVLFCADFNNKVKHSTSSIGAMESPKRVATGDENVQTKKPPIDIGGSSIVQTSVFN